jgi:hypothetical protein
VHFFFLNFSGNKVNDKKKHSNHTANHNNNNTPNGTNGTVEASSLLKKAEVNMEESPFGPLTQRLVQAFLEENLLTPMEDINTDLGGME